METVSGNENTTTVQTFHWVSSELESVIASVGGGWWAPNQIPLNGALERENPTLTCLKKSGKRFRKPCITSLSISKGMHTHTPAHTTILCSELIPIHKCRFSLWLTLAHSTSDHSSETHKACCVLLICVWTVSLLWFWISVVLIRQEGIMLFLYYYYFLYTDHYYYVAIKFKAEMLTVNYNSWFKSPPDPCWCFRLCFAGMTKM